MNARQALEIIKEHCVPAVQAGTLTPDDRLSIRDGYTMWITEEGAKLTSLTDSDLVAIEVRADEKYDDTMAGIHVLLYSKYKRIGAIVNSRTQYSLSVSRKGETVKPYVDDIAQIAGIDIKCTDAASIDKIRSLFKKRSSILIKDSGSMCADITLDDVLATAMITEKACRIHIQSRYLGGAKAINVIESALMRFIYIKK